MNRTLLRTDPIIALFLLGVVVLAALQYRKPPETTSTTAPPITSPQTSAPSAIKQASGRIIFDHIFFDFGAVTEGDIVKHTFKFKNEGAGKLKLLKVETSCGCTTINDVLREYQPGESAEMEVVVDTKGKKGIIVKTVTLFLESNDADKVELSLAMNLQPAPHPKIEKMRNINADAACKTCHLEAGEGQSGIFLYHRVCSQCHGKRGAGGFGRALNDPEWQKVDDAHIQKVIRRGLAEKSMPSFVEGVTPPLTESQVTSLLQYIRSLVKQ